jgi:hypothetical protein
LLLFDIGAFQSSLGSLFTWNETMLFDFGSVQNRPGSLFAYNATFPADFGPLQAAMMSMQPAMIP